MDLKIENVVSAFIGCIKALLSMALLRLYSISISGSIKAILRISASVKAQLSISVSIKAIITNISHKWLQDDDSDEDIPKPKVRTPPKPVNQRTVL